MPRRFIFILIALILFILVGGLYFAVDLYFDWLWFEELHMAAVFTTTVLAKGMVGSATLLLSFLFLYPNLWVAGSGPGRIEFGIPTPAGQITAYAVPEKHISRILGLAALAISFVVSARTVENWGIFWRGKNAVPFGKADPVFGRDIAFYFFELPVIEEIVHIGLLLTLLTLAGIIALYYFKGTLRWNRARTFKQYRRAGSHISVLASLLFALLSANAYLDRFGILYSTSGPMFGATYTDIHATLPFISALGWASLAGAVLWIYNVFASNNRGGIAAVGLYVVVLLAGKIYPAIVWKFVVAPNEFAREAPQIEHNIHATIAAYGLDKVQERNLSGDKALSPRDIQENAATIHSIRLWDHQPLLDTFSQIQEIRTYYDFTSVDNDRYILGGEPQQVMLSARELNSTSLPERNWINEHLTYTHGYGLTLGPVNRMTNEGLPVLLVKDIPPRSSEAVLKIDRPEIYFGELTGGYVVVKSGQKEFDYPAGEENVFTSYQGKGGVPVHSFWRRLLFAIYLKDPNILLSPLLKNDSRFLYFRDIKTRVSRAAPFLRYDPDPYIAISGGRLYWIQDAYTVGDRYPYSLPTSSIGNYVRNSVKIVIDAYDGSMDFYVADPNDPVLQVYQKIFPGIFRPLSEMPSDLRQHLRYPELIFAVQSYIYSIYHMSNPQIFYNKEDLWEIPAFGAAGGERTMAPYYTIMRLPREKKEEFILMIPFTPNRKDNLSAWMVARSDAENYGQLMVYRFPKQKLVYGPKQIVARINQDAEISRQISLWDQRGSQVNQGTLLVIPIDEALVYVRPLFIRAETGKIPELKRVIVAYENKIVMEETLDGALARIFTGETSTAASPTKTEPAASESSARGESTTQGLAQQAREAYDRALQAQRQGDWARYGDELKRLGSILEDLRKSGQSSKK